MTSQSGRTSLLLVALAVVALLAGTLLPPFDPTNAQGLPPDFAVPSGRFFTQTRGDAPANFGYMISDDNVSSFWRDFQRFGGVDVVGYPVTHRFLYNGSVIQAMQKVVFRWDPALNTTTFVNVFDELSAAGYDQWLLSQQIPLSRDWSADATRSFAEVIRAHQALLDEDPAIKAAYLAAGENALSLYGLPMGTGDYPTVFVIRAQRAVFQRWKVQTPWARAGQVTIANGGDIFKASGLLPFNAVLPATLAGQLFQPNTPTPSATPTQTATPTVTTTPTQTPTVAPTGTPAPTVTPAGSGTIYFDTFEAIVQSVTYTTTLQGAAGVVNAFSQWAVVFLRIRNNGPEPNFLAPEDLIFFDSAGRLGTPDIGAGQQAAQEQFGRSGPYEVFQPTFFNEVVLVWQLPVESRGGGVVANVPYGLPQPPPFVRVATTNVLRFGDTWEMTVTDAVATTSIGQPNVCQYPRGIFLVVFARVRNISSGLATIRLNDVRIQDGARRTFDFTFQHIQLGAQAGFNRPAGVGTTFQPNETRDAVLVFDVAFESVGRLNGLTPRFTPQLHPHPDAIDLGVVRTLPINPACIRGATPQPGFPTVTNTPTPTPTPVTTALWRTVFSASVTLRALSVFNLNNVVAVGDGGVAFRGGGASVPAPFAQINANISPQISPANANLRGVEFVREDYTVIVGDSGVAVRVNFLNSPPSLAAAPTGGIPNFRGLSLLPNITNDGWIIGDQSQSNVPVYRWQDISALGAFPVPVVNPSSLVAVDTASNSLAFVSTDDSDRRIYRWNGSSWTLAGLRSPTTFPLRARVNSLFTFTNGGWAVGNNGLILNWDGSTWQEQFTGLTTDNLNSLALTDPNTGWAVGDNGRILRLQNGQWSIFTNNQFGVPQNPNLIAVTNGVNQSSEFWAIGLGTGADSGRSLILRLGP